MIIPNNCSIPLHYEPATDVLSVALPDMLDYSMSEVIYSFDCVVEVINNYDIKKLLLDSSKSKVEVANDTYREVILKFSNNLLKTRLRKIARISTVYAAQEHRATLVAEEIKQYGGEKVEYQTYRTRSEAIKWLNQ